MVSAPVPLTGPKGHIWAWACGRCNRVTSCGTTLAAVEDIDDQAARFLWDAERCCVCDDCKQPVDDDQRGRRSCSRCCAVRREKHAAEREAWVAKLAAEGLRPCPERYCGTEGVCPVCADNGVVPL